MPSNSIYLYKKIHLFRFYCSLWDENWSGNPNATYWIVYAPWIFLISLGEKKNLVHLFFQMPYKHQVHWIWNFSKQFGKFIRYKFSNNGIKGNDYICGRQNCDKSNGFSWICLCKSIAEKRNFFCGLDNENCLVSVMKKPQNFGIDRLWLLIFCHFTIKKKNSNLFR